MRSVPSGADVARKLGFEGVGHNGIVNTLASSKLIGHRQRGLILRWAGIDVAPSAVVYPSCFFGGSRISIGPQTFINWGCFFDNIGEIAIGARCSVGMQVMFCTSDHHHGGHDQRGGALVGRKIVVGDGCWLGARVIVLPGVTVGPGCIVGAGSVVTKDCEPNSLVVGSPARLVRMLQ